MADTAPPTKPFGRSVVPPKHQDTYPFIDPLAGDACNLKVLITGASKGIGLATAKSYARAGAAGIALVARTGLDRAADEILQAAIDAGREKPSILKLQADICSPMEVEKAILTVASQFRNLDVLINNASRLEKWNLLAATNVGEWWKTWEVNVKGTYLVTKMALPLILEGRSKTILTVTSAGAFATIPGGSAYMSTKTAQIRSNDFLMAEYGEQGLIAFAVHPGSVATDSALKMPDFMHSILTETPELAADTITWLTRTRKEWLAGRFVFGPSDMEELEVKKSEIVGRDLLKLRLTV